MFACKSFNQFVNIDDVSSKTVHIKKKYIYLLHVDHANPQGHVILLNCEPLDDHTIQVWSFTRAPKLKNITFIASKMVLNFTDRQRNKQPEPKQ